jgi:hypothetical protein
MGAQAAAALQPPAGFNEIVQVFGDLRQFVEQDGSVSQKWPEQILTTIALPFAMQLDWDRSKTVQKISCHRKIAGIMSAVFEQISREGLGSKVVSYGGCYMFRPKRGVAQYSAHAWGIAIDLNPSTNQLKTAGDMDRNLVRIFEAHGFEWGGHFTRRDPMHFQFCRGY